MSARDQYYDEDEINSRGMKKLRPQNLLSPGFLDSDLPNQLGLIRVREESSFLSVGTSSNVNNYGRSGIFHDRQSKHTSYEENMDMDVDQSSHEESSFGLSHHTNSNNSNNHSNSNSSSNSSVRENSMHLFNEAQAKESRDHITSSSSKQEHSDADSKQEPISPEEINVEQKFKSARNLYLSTNTVIAPNNLSNPDVGEVLFCVAAVIQAQIFEDDFLSEDRKALHPEFNVIPELPADLGGHIDTIPERILQQESANDEVLRAQLMKLVVPTIDTVVKFLALIRSRSHYSVECNIIALVYLNRMTTLSRLPLTMVNWRSLWVTCIIIAQKFWEDNPLKTSAFSIILPSISKTQLREWEKKGLDLLEYSIRVKPSLYAKYYFELRQLFVEIIGPRVKWSMKPMNRAGENKLSLKSKLIYSKDDTCEGVIVDIRGLKAFKT